MQVEARRETVIAVPPSRVWRALTDARELGQWWGEQAVVDDDNFVVAGKGVVGGRLDGRVVKRQSNRTFVFSWPLGGVETRFEIELERVPQHEAPQADFTRVTAAHVDVPEAAFPNALWPEDSLSASLVMWMRQLRLWLERAEATDRFAYLDAYKGPVVERSIIIEQKPDVVWRYITDPELRAQWLDMSLGAEVERDEGRLYVHRWEHDQPGPSTVRWELEPLPDGRTKVVLRHDGVYRGPFDYNLGWHDYLIALVQTAARPLFRRTLWMNASSKQLWPFLNTEAGMRQWWGGEMRYEPEVGGRVRFVGHGANITGRVVELVPEKRLAFTFAVESPGWAEVFTEPTVITIDLVPDKAGTRVTLTHSGWENVRGELFQRIFEDFQRGWADSYELETLEKHFAHRAAKCSHPEGNIIETHQPYVT